MTEIELPTGTLGDDVLLATGGRESFDGLSGSDTVSYQSSSVGIYANLATGTATRLARVMPLGDSITHGVVSSTDSGDGGYRTRLWTLLRQADLAVDFLGTQSSGSASLPDRDHQGMSGKTIDFLDANDSTYLAAAAPDVILLMIGTNDIGKGDTPQQMIAELRALIVSLSDQRPEATVLVSTIPPSHSASRQAKVEAYNAALPGLVAELAATRDLRFVDMRDLTLADITAPPADSGIHPNAAGYARIAARWFDALVGTGLFADERDTLTGIENLTGSAQRDWLMGDNGANRLNGLAGADDLIGGGGHDTLDGGLGADTLAGGTGDDLYVIDTTSDRVIEESGGGSDTLATALARFALAAGHHVENLRGLGSSGQTLTGNDAANRIEGGAGADRIGGGAGADVLVGGNSNDTYSVDSTGDWVVETDATGGSDSVVSSVSFTLGAFVERLGLSGSSAIEGIGNELANRISGSVADNAISGGLGNDSLSGEAGRDRLAGGLGTDVLRGGEGADVFVFDTAPLAANGYDRLADFASGSDRLALDDTAYGALRAGEAEGHVRASQLRLGTAALDADDVLIYDQGRGRLVYDADATGAGKGVLVATLVAGQVLVADDILLI